MDEDNDVFDEMNGVGDLLDEDVDDPNRNGDEGLTLEELGGLHEDIMDGNVEAVRDLILDIQEEHGPVLDLISKEVTLEPLPEDHPLNGFPQCALHRAALTGSIPMMSALIAAHPKVDINQRMLATGFTPLHVAVAVGCTAATNYLASNGADVNAKASNDGIESQRNDSVEMTENYDRELDSNKNVSKLKIHEVSGHSLVNDKALDEVDYSNKCLQMLNLMDKNQSEGDTSMNNRSSSMTSSVTSSSSTSRTSGHTPLHVAARHGQDDIAKILCVRGASIDCKDAAGCTPLHVAARAGELKMVAFLLQRNEDARYLNAVDEKGETALHASQHKGSVQCVELLVKAGVHLDEQDGFGNTALMTSLKSYKKDVLNPDESQDTISHLKCIDLLLKAGCAVNMKNQNGDTALHLCAAHADILAARLLQEYRAHVSLTNNADETALFLAREIDMMEFLVESGINVHHQSHDSGDGVIHQYARSEQVSSLQMLEHLIRSYNVDVNCQNFAGNTALHCACHSGNLDKVTILIRSGANRKHVNAQQKLPVQVALERGHRKIVLFLLEEIDKQMVNNGDLNRRTLLHGACEKGDLDLVQKLHRLGADLNIEDKCGKNAALLASENKHKNVLLYLLQNGATLSSSGCTANIVHYFASQGYIDVLDVLQGQGHAMNALDQSNHSVLHVALDSSQWDTALHLLQRFKVTSSSQSVNGDTPLHVAVQNCRDVNLIASVVESEADVNMPNSAGKTALHLAVEHNSLEVVMYLVETGANVNIQDNEGNTALHTGLIQAVKPSNNNNVDYIETIRFILEGQAKITVDLQNNIGRTVLHYACQVGDKDLLKEILCLKPDVNLLDRSGQSSLMIASEYSCDKCVEMLLKHGAKVNVVDKNKESALFKATKSRASAIVDLLIENKAVVNAARQDGKTCLHTSLMDKNYDVVEILLSNNADVNVVDEEGCSPLHVAAQSAPNDVICLLLDHQADVTLTDHFGKTALHYSMQNRDQSVDHTIITYANRKDFDILEARDVNGQTALHIAASRLSYDHMSMLLEEGADVNAADNAGKTPLHITAKFQETDVLELLISHDAQVNCSNKAGMTPLLVALSHGNVAGATILLDYDADITACDTDGETVLHKTVRIMYVRPAFVQSFVRRGLSCTAKNKAAQTPVDVLRSLKRENEGALLQALGIEEIP